MSDWLRRKGCQSCHRQKSKSHTNHPSWCSIVNNWIWKPIEKFFLALRHQKKELVPYFEKCFVYHQKRRKFLFMELRSVTDQKMGRLSVQSTHQLCEFGSQYQLATPSIRSKKPSEQHQLASSSWKKNLPVAKYLSNYCPRSQFSAQLLSNLENFSLWREAMHKYYKTQDSVYDPPKLAVHSNCPQKSTLYEIFIVITRRKFH